MGVINFSYKWRSALIFGALLFVNILIPAAGYGAPIPATGSSLLVAPEQGLFWSRQGFRLKSEGTNWSLAAPSSEDEIQVRYLKPNSSASLAVKTEMLKAELTLENYAKRWMKDYSSYGFEVLGTQPFTQNGSKGLVIDLLHQKSDYQLRQVLFLKNKKAVVLTCRDSKKEFERTLRDCNQISKSFEWSQLSNDKRIN